MSLITELIPQENADLIHYNIDQTVISNDLYLSKICNSDFEEEEQDKKELYEAYSKPAIFYPYTEDFNYEARVKHIKNLNHIIIPEDLVDGYTGDQSELQYLTSTPVSYIIFGKPDIGESELSRLLSDNWKCVYINPESVIREEIISGSRAGKCIEYNLKAGRSVGPEVVLRLVEKRVNTQTAYHRGFIISGFPMLPNNNFQEDPISSESAVFNAEEIFEELLPMDIPGPGSASREKVSLVSEKSAGSVVDDGDEEDELKKSKKVPEPELVLADIPDFGSGSMNIIRHTDSFYSMAKPEGQIEFLLHLLKHPFIIIYIMSNNLDVINKRDQYRFDISTEQEIVLPYKDEESDIPFDATDSVTVVDEFASEEYNDSNRMYKVRLPLHCKTCISDQIRQYRCHAHSIIEKRIVYHDPQYFIKIDGRLSGAEMFKNVDLRLKTIGFQPVLIPEKLYNIEAGGEGESPGRKEQPVEESYDELKNRLIVGPMYKWQLSNWGFKCPVALKEGHIVKGNPKNAVKFMNKIFYLSDENALVKFYRNPRLYLIPVSPRAPCRIWIFGPKRSGKSLIATAFSHMFECKVFDPYELDFEYRSRKEYEFIEKVRTAAITEGLAQLNQRRCLEREEQIEQWQIRALELLEEVLHPKSIDEFDENVVEKVIEKVEVYVTIKPFSLERIPEETEDFEDFENFPQLPSIDALEYALLQMNLPTDRTIMEELLNEPVKILNYLPLYLLGPTEPATIFDTFVTQFVNDVIDITTIPDLTLTLTEKVDMFKTTIEDAENEHYEQFSRRGGWIINGMLPDLALIEALAPDFIADEIFCMQDSNPEVTTEEKSFSYSNNDYRRLFFKLKRSSIASNIIDVNLSSVSKYLIPAAELSEFHIPSEEAIVEVTEEELAAAKQLHLELLDQFKLDWESIVNFLEDKELPPIIIDTWNKTNNNIVAEAYTMLENKYRRTASILTDAERDQLMTDYGGQISTNEEEYGEGIGESVDLYSINRRLGNANIYCPIAFNCYFVLWKGKENLTVKFADQLHFLSSENAMNQFISDPRLYLNDQPIVRFPPPRICVIGVPGSGKTTLAKQLANNFGIKYICFDSLIMEYFDFYRTMDLDSVFRLDPEFHEKLIIFPERLTEIRDYIESGETFPDNLVTKVLSTLWFKEPCVTTGFVLDNFPRRLSDISILLSCYFIPDIVIEVSATREEVHDKCYERRYEQWRTELNEKQMMRQIENDAILDTWQQTRYSRFCTLSDGKRWQRIRDRKRKLLTTPVDSDVSIDTLDDIGERLVPEDFVYEGADEIKDIQEINMQLDIEMPQPVFDDVWETEDEANERIEGGIDSDFSREIEYLDEIRDLLKSENIDCVAVEKNHMMRDAMKHVDEFKFRRQSLFERVYEITVSVADRLIEEGYYFMSRFGRNCPVQVYEDVNTIQMYIPAEDKMNIFPVIYRRYIYFVVGEKNLFKFQDDPLKYTMYNRHKIQLMPVKIAIIGPPKCGKSMLAERFRQEFGLHIITRGNALRYVLKQFPTCDLAQHIQNVIGQGWAATDEMVAKAVEALTLVGKSICQGYVLDGFPTSQEEMQHLIALGIVPHLIFNIQTSLEKIKEYAKTAKDHGKIPAYSFAFIKLRYNQWNRTFKDLHMWLEKDYQNVITIKNDDNKWEFWDKIKTITLQKWITYSDYIHEIMYEQVFPLSTFCVTSAEFFERESVYRNYCPICYSLKNVLNQDGKYPDRNCIVQFHHYYYYICHEHQRLFHLHPKLWIPPSNTVLLPDHLPVIVNDCKNQPFYEDGLCIVSFWDNQPSRVLIQGVTKFMVLYRDVYYIFCSAECLDKFMKLPIEYYDKIILFRDKDPLILKEIRNLPIMGYLEQYAGKLLIEAVLNAEIHRPFHPCMSISLSVALHIGLYLKCRNTKTPKQILPKYEEARRKFNCRRRKLKVALDFFKNRMNPFVYVPEVPKKEKKITLEPLEEKELEFNDIFTERYFSNISSFTEVEYMSG